MFGLDPISLWFGFLAGVCAGLIVAFIMFNTVGPGKWEI